MKAPPMLLAHRAPVAASWTSIASDGWSTRGPRSSRQRTICHTPKCSTAAPASRSSFCGSATAARSWVGWRNYARDPRLAKTRTLTHRERQRCRFRSGAVSTTQTFKPVPRAIGLSCEERLNRVAGAGLPAAVEPWEINQFDVGSGTGVLLEFSGETGSGNQQPFGGRGDLGCVEL